MLQTARCPLHSTANRVEAHERRRTTEAMPGDTTPREIRW
jgi:hypothetical protein